MAIVVIVVNLKGGVGKSTLAMMISEYMAFRFGKKVLLIDMDAQANLSYIMVPHRSIQLQEDNQRTIYHFFKSSLSGRSVSLGDYIARPPLVVSNIARSSGETIDMIISTPGVAQLDEEILILWEGKKAMPPNYRFILKDGIGNLQGQYDIILIDCPPGLSLFSSTALIASDFFISPIVPEPLSLKGVELIQNRATALNRTYHCKVDFAGVILNIVKHYRNTHRLWADRIYSERKDELKPFTFWLPDNERLRALGEFEIDEERIKDGWGGGVDKKFYGVYAKYSVSYQLSNPSIGLLGETSSVEGPQYKLHERLQRLVEEFSERVGVLGS